MSKPLAISQTPPRARSPSKSLPRNNNPLWQPVKERLSLARSPRGPIPEADDLDLEIEDLELGVSEDTEATLNAACTPACCIFDGVSSRAACNLEDCFLLGEGMAKVAASPFDLATGTGILNLGSAENRLMTKELVERLNKTPLQITPAMLAYGTYHGSQRLRETVADHMNRTFMPVEPLKAVHITVFAGCASTLSALFQVLCDPGDGVLIPAPLFGGFLPHLKLASRARPIAVQMPRPHYRLSIPRLQKALDRERRAGRPVRALLLCHPHNPLGFAHTKEELIAAMEFCHRENLHLVSDEIYAGSSFGTDFVSSLAISPSEVPGGFNVNRLHVVYGLSKDFCMNGFRVGFVATHAARVLASLQRIAFFHNISTPMDAMITDLLADKEWTAWFAEENRRRLREQYKVLEDWLNARGIPHLKAEAGFYCFINLSKYIPGATTVSDDEDSEDEVAIADRTPERKLWYDFLDAGVYLAPGEGFSVDNELGWFRLVFAIDDAELLLLALERMDKVLAKCLPTKK